MTRRRTTADRLEGAAYPFSDALGDALNDPILEPAFHAGWDARKAGAPRETGGTEYRGAALEAWHRAYDWCDRSEADEKTPETIRVRANLAKFFPREVKL